MITAKNQLYSITTAANILNLPQTEISRLEVWANCIFIKLNGRPAKMISFKKFKENFIESRKKRSSELTVFKAPMVGGYVVKNEKKGSSYIVTPYKDSIDCACDDYTNQLRLNPETLGTKYACCKHVYAVLKHLGYNSLKEYMVAEHSRSIQAE